MSKALMIQGTGSGVGKSLIVAGLCRIFRDIGINVAPFKAQNMALNSFITKEGGEIGRAQALQAEAARIEPSVDMNPILLKASDETSCQVIVNGKVYSNMKAKEYYSFKDEVWEFVKNAYKRLSSKYDLIVIEGAGSPAEINLCKDEVVNMRVARYTDAPVILIGDIDKGGVFASFYGTVGLLDGDADYIKAFIVNKFRGDPEILRPGLEMIYERTKRPVIGIIPYLGELGLHEEDGIPFERIKGSGEWGSRAEKIKIVVVHHRYISNFTDFDPFLYEPDVELVYSSWKGDIENADLIIVPGSKNTVKDLLFLRENGIEDSIKRAVKKGINLIGVCGGYQMLGKRISDPYSIESEHKEIKGMGLLDIETTFEKIKTTCQVEATLVKSSEFRVKSENILKGYEIHMGESKGDTGLFKLKRLVLNSKPCPHSLSPKFLSGNPLVEIRTPNSELITDGSLKGNVWGTYVHGIFDNDRFRRGIINSIRKKKGLNHLRKVVDYSSLREEAMDKWTGVIKENIDMKFIEGLLRGLHV